jgi:predicted RNase H-like HicB family nuclease
MRQVDRLAAYTHAAMHKACYEILPNGKGYFGKIGELQGIWTNANTLEACHEEPQEVLEEWIILSLRRGIISQRSAVIHSREFTMSFKAVRAHFDGKQIHLDEPCQLDPETPLLVIVLQNSSPDEEREDWLRISQSALERAYGSNEPTYSLDAIKEPNPDYEGK